MNNMDRKFLKIASSGYWNIRRLAMDGAKSERAMARVCLIMDYPGQKREGNGQFGTGKKSGGVAKSSKSGTMSKSKRSIPKDSSGTSYRKPRARNVSPKKSGSSSSSSSSSSTSSAKTSGTTTTTKTPSSSTTKTSVLKQIVNKVSGK